MSRFKWGHSFLKTNEQLLELYANCKTAPEVIEVQNMWLSGTQPRPMLPPSMLEDDDDESGSEEEERGGGRHERTMHFYRNLDLPPTDSEDEETDSDEDDSDTDDSDEESEEEEERPTGRVWREEDEEAQKKAEHSDGEESARADLERLQT